MDRREWCERVEEALADGRFLEDPAFYQPHVASCARCRGPVEGLFVLNGLLARARQEAPIEALDVNRADEIVLAAVVAERRHRRKRNVGLAVFALALLGALWQLRGPRPAPAPRDPVAIARGLHRAIFPERAPPQYELLKTDPSLRARYLLALQDPSSLVRRTALHALAWSGVPLPRSSFEEVLSHAQEDLETPFVVANLSDDARGFVSALDARRTATLMAVLSGLTVESAAHGRVLPAEKVLPFVRHHAPEVRQQALFALSLDPDYDPGEELEELLRTDTDAGVRERAAALLLDRRGEPGARSVVAHLQTSRDWRLETALTPRFPAFVATRTLSRHRVADLSVPIVTALAHARALWRAGVTEPPASLIDRALTDSDPAALVAAGALIAGADWSAYRARLQDCWATARGDVRGDLALLLTAWDLTTTDEHRLKLALHICEVDRGTPSLLPRVEDLTRAAAPVIREQAQALLRSWSKR